MFCNTGEGSKKVGSEVPIVSDQAIYFAGVHLQVEVGIQVYPLN